MTVAQTIEAVKDEKTSSVGTSDFDFTGSERAGHFVFTAAGEGPAAPALGASTHATGGGKEVGGVEADDGKTRGLPSSGRSRGREAPTCILCTSPRANQKVVYCSLHRRAFDNIQNQSKILQRKHGMDSTEMKSYEHYWVRGSTAQRHKAVIQYARMFLDDGAKGSGAKPSRGGGRKGVFDFSEQYKHLFKENVVEEEDEVFWRADIECFCVRLQETSKWSMEQCMAEWDRLLTDESTGRDHGGPGGCLRLHVPPNLVATSYVHKRHQRVEEKVVEKKKNKLHDSEEASQVCSELNVGFSKEFTHGAAAAFGLTAAAPSGGWHDRTASGCSDHASATVNVLEKIATDLGVRVPPSSATSTSGPSSEHSGGEGATAEPSAISTAPVASVAATRIEDPGVPKETKLYDVALRRTEAHAKWKAEVDRKMHDLSDILDEAMEDGKPNKRSHTCFHWGQPQSENLSA